MGNHSPESMPLNIVIENSSGQLFMNTEQEIKRKLIAAAMDEFYEASFDEATMRSISKRTGFSSATVYKYFDSKHKLAMVLGAQIIERYNNEIELHLKGIEVNCMLSNLFAESLKVTLR